MAVLVLRLAPEWSDHHGRTTAVARLRQALATIPHPGIDRLSLAGMPVARADGMALIQQDQATLLPLSLLVTLIVLYLILPDWTDVLLVVLTTGFTLVYTFGLMGWLGWKFSILSSVAPVILVTTGTTYSVHPLVRLPRRGRLPDRERFPETFADLFPALAQCCLTTIVGFASLLPIQITLVHEFVAIVGTGVAIAFIVAMTLLPAMVAGLAVDGGPAAASPAQLPVPRRSRRDILRRLLNDFLPQVWRRPRLVLALLGLLMLAGLLAGTHVRVKAYVFDDFWEDSALMQQIRRAEQACLGILPVAVLVEAAPRETVVRHRYLSQAASITAFLRTLPGIGKVDSPTDFIGEVWRLFQEGEGSPPPFPPDESSLSAIFRFMLSAGNLAADQDFLTRDLSTLQIKARLFDLESASAAALLDRIRGALAATADASTTLQLTGTTVMIQETYRQTISSFMQSLGFVIGCTVIVFAWFYRDRTLVGWATAGNLGPLLCTFGFMGWWGIPIKISTITIFGIALGLAVDDTIHFLTVFRQWRARGRTDAEAARRAIVGTARGMVVSSAALFAGFLVLLWSEFEAQYLIGLLLCFNIAIALLFDLAFIPAAVSLWGPASGQSVSAPKGRMPQTTNG
ncbi:MAG: membrane protein [Candidatus Ozemobacter sibiricus]|uniref:Membrane protein n=1 Tax=Candidatus Ozemobacter sibiricus TaxID=2268124 RepID=A0A367ZF12_9BACT|nr:MAG: membrane protein [Candidatus Ozemobacter sibiricus]